MNDNAKPGPGGAPTRCTTLPEGAEDRKQYPVASGVLDYFPDAIAAIARLSWQGNEQHNPGLSLRWTRSKSGDESDTMMRHFLQRGTVDTDGIRHSVKMAWRALAIVQKEIEAEQPPPENPAKADREASASRGEPYSYYTDPFQQRIHDAEVKRRIAAGESYETGADLIAAARADANAAAVRAAWFVQPLRRGSYATGADLPSALGDADAAAVRAQQPTRGSSGESYECPCPQCSGIDSSARDGDGDDDPRPSWW